MITLPCVAMALAAAGPVRFERHDIDSFPAGYQVAVVDVDGDGRPDVVALSTEADRVDWYRNPDWKRHPVARTARNIDLAARDLDGDGRPEFALASGFYFGESGRGGEIQWLSRADSLARPWRQHRIAVDPVVHRLRWGDLDGDGRPELVHAPLFGRGSDGARDPKPAHLWAFRLPRRPAEDPWKVWKIDETLTVLHGLWVGDLDGDDPDGDDPDGDDPDGDDPDGDDPDGDRRDEVLTASFEGICRFDFQGPPGAGRWRKVVVSAGVQPADRKPGTARGSSEVAPGRLGAGRPLLAAIEPWHGNQVVVYTPQGDGRWRRRVLDGTLIEGHAVAVADLDADGIDEIVAGWRGGKGGLALYDPVDARGEKYTRTILDRGINVEGAVVADLNRDGRADLVVIAGRSNNLAWYENRGLR